MRNKIILLSTALIVLLILSACANTPGQSVKVYYETQTAEADTNVTGGDQSSQDRSASLAESINGPTVTPIVLSVVKKGSEGSMIVREETTEDPSEIQYITEVPTAAPAASSSAMKDEMSVYSFSPASGSTVLPGEALHLDVTLQNTGTTTWQTSYKIVDYSNNAMAVTKEYNLPNAVAPGGTVLISIYLAAPTTAGSYPENFYIQDAYGVQFGSFDYVLTVGDYSVITPIITYTPSMTPTYYSADGITATPDSLAWMCVDRERSKLQDCKAFCENYPDTFPVCYYDGERYLTPVPEEQ